MEHEQRILKIAVCVKDEPIFHQCVTEIEIVDEAAGEYLEVSQCSDKYDGKIAIDPHEWPSLRDAIDRMIKECRNYGND